MESVGEKEFAPEPILVGLADAASRLSLSKHALRKHVARGRVPAVKLGGRLLFRLESLKRLAVRLESEGRRRREHPLDVGAPETENNGSSNRGHEERR